MSARAPMRYFDYQATTPADPAVLAAMLPFFQEKFGNPHSTTHRYGWEAMAAVEAAAAKIAGLIRGAADGLVFTSGATESNNLALKGVLARSPVKRLVTVRTEHACILETADWLEGQGVETVRLDVGPDGLIDLAQLDQALSPPAALVSVMAVNNEIGVIQPLAAISAMARRAGALMHTDAAQAFGKIPLDVEAMGLDLVSISGHKIYGPKGIGALWVRPGVPLEPQIHGGGQQKGRRSGTLAAPLCAGLGEAAKLAAGRMAADAAAHQAQARLLLERLEAAGVRHQVNGSMANRFWGNLNISFPGLDGARLLTDLRRFALSSGAACASAEAKPSYVLEALGVPEALAKSTLRIGFGRPTADEDVLALAEAIIASARAPKAMAS